MAPTDLEFVIFLPQPPRVLELLACAIWPGCNDCLKALCMVPGWHHAGPGFLPTHAQLYSGEVPFAPVLCIPHPAGVQMSLSLSLGTLTGLVTLRFTFCSSVRC